MILGFFINAIASVSIGFIVALLASFFFKTFPFIRHSEVIETAMILFFGFIAYLLAETLFSGVISVLVCGIVMSHYLFYNLTDRG